MATEFRSLLMIEGLKAGAISLAELIEVGKLRLAALGDLGAKPEYKNLHNGMIRLQEIRVSLINLYTIIEGHGACGVWSVGKPGPKGTARDG